MGPKNGAAASPANPPMTPAIPANATFANAFGIGSPNATLTPKSRRAPKSGTGLRRPLNAFTPSLPRVFNINPLSASSCPTFKYF